MTNQSPVTVKFENGKPYYYPKHHWVSNWRFSNESEAIFVNAAAQIAEENGLTVNDLHRLTTFVLRMLKSTSEWVE